MSLVQRAEISNTPQLYRSSSYQAIFAELSLLMSFIHAEVESCPLSPSPLLHRTSCDWFWAGAPKFILIGLKLVVFFSQAQT